MLSTITSAYAQIQSFLEPYMLQGRQVLDVFHIIFSTSFDIILFFTFLITIVYLFITCYMLFFYKKKVETFIEDESLFPTVTVHIPTYNELAAINCAKKCLEFDYPKEKFTIFIGDDSNKPHISKKIAEFAKKHDMVTVYKRKKNVGFKPGNLNNMLQHTKSDYILIFDSDYLPQKDFLRKLVSPAIKNPELAGVQAKWKVVNPQTNFTTALGTGITNTFHVIMLPFIKTFSPTITFCGSAELVQRKTLVELGGWKSGALTEDIDYSFRCVNAGKHIYYLEDLECDNEVPQTPNDLFKQQMRWAYGVIKSFLFHGKTLFLSKKVTVQKKIMAVLFGSGYIMTTLIMLLTISGTLAIITHPPQPINFVEFVLTTVTNILLTCGLLVATIVAGFTKKTGIRGSIKLILASFSIGLVQIFYVTKGVYKALTNQPMQWFMLKKTGNEKRL